MLLSKPKLLILLGFILMLLGVVFPFLMVIHILKSTFFLNFFSYTLSLLGMICGAIGIAFDFRAK